MGDGFDGQSDCRVLLTSGGTRVPIDAVRWIGNHSTGRFGSCLAAEFLRAGALVDHLHARDAQVPYRAVVDLRQREVGSSTQSSFEVTESLRSASTNAHLAWDRYRPFSFTTFDEYADLLLRLTEQLTEHPSPIIVLAAAVADYRPALPFSGKISSQPAEQTISLIQTPKLIAKVRAAAPNAFLVGFKLTSGRTAEETQLIAHQALEKSGASVILANDLDQVRPEEHVLHIVRPSKIETMRASELAGGVTELAACVVQRILAWELAERKEVEQCESFGE